MGKLDATNGGLSIGRACAGWWLCACLGCWTGACGAANAIGHAVPVVGQAESATPQPAEAASSSSDANRTAAQAASEADIAAEVEVAGEADIAAEAGEPTAVAELPVGLEDGQSNLGATPATAEATTPAEQGTDSPPAAGGAGATGESVSPAPDQAVSEPGQAPLAGQSSAETPAAPQPNASAGTRASPPAAWLNLPTNVLLGVVLVTLGIASLVGQYLRRRPTEAVNPALVLRFRQRLNAWWLMCAILVFGLLLQPVGTVVLFGLVSFWALREFITMAPTRRGDHRALFWALIVFTPLQYILIGIERSGFHWRSGSPIDFYGLYSIMIPVYASLFVPARIAMSGDHKRFLERTAQITFGLLICVYSLSYAPALINLELAESDGTPWSGSPAGLLFFFILMSQLSDILQWTWGQFVGRRMIAEDVSTSRTWEGFAGGTLSTGLIGATLFWVTPFSFWEAACMSMVIGVMGMFGGMTMSAIKRDRGVNDYGSLVLGHAGVLDRIDTVCFAAPVFYHLTRFFFTV